jgi:hypothetical protein
MPLCHTLILLLRDVTFEDVTFEDVTFEDVTFEDVTEDETVNFTVGVDQSSPARRCQHE